MSCPPAPAPSPPLGAIQFLLQRGVCPRCVLVLLGTRTMASYQSPSSVIDALQRTVSSKDLGLGSNGGPHMEETVGAPLQEDPEGAGPTEESAEKEVEEAVERRGLTEMVEREYDGSKTCVACLGLLQDSETLQETIEKVRLFTIEKVRLFTIEEVRLFTIEKVRLLLWKRWDFLLWKRWDFLLWKRWVFLLWNRWDFLLWNRGWDFILWKRWDFVLWKRWDFLL